MTKNKEPNLFIKELKNVFEKIVTMPIENENGSVSCKIAIKNKINSKQAIFEDSIKKISSKEKKTRGLYWSLYVGSILNKN